MLPQRTIPYLTESHIALGTLGALWLWVVPTAAHAQPLKPDSEVPSTVPDHTSSPPQRALRCAAAWTQQSPGPGAEVDEALLSCAFDAPPDAQWLVMERLWHWTPKSYCPLIPAGTKAEGYPQALRRHRDAHLMRCGTFVARTAGAELEASLALFLDRLPRGQRVPKTWLLRALGSKDPRLRALAAPHSSPRVRRQLLHDPSAHVALAVLEASLVDAADTKGVPQLTAPALDGWRDAQLEQALSWALRAAQCDLAAAIAAKLAERDPGTRGTDAAVSACRKQSTHGARAEE